MSDIQLVFGVDSPSTTVNIQKELNSIISSLNLDGVKLDSVQIELDNTAVNNFKSTLDGLTAYAQSEATKIQVAYQNALNNSNSGSGGSGNGKGGKGKGASHTLLQFDTTEYNNALAKIQTLQAKINQLNSSYDISSSGGTANIYDQLNKANAELENLKNNLKAGSLYADDFKESIALAGSEVSQATAELKTLGAAVKSTKTFTKDSTEYNNALVKCGNLLGEVKSAYLKWTAAADGDTSNAYNELKKLESVIQNIMDDLEAGKLNSIDEFKKRFSAAVGVYTASKAEIIGAGKDKPSLKDQWAKVTEDLTKWISVREVIHAASETVKKMVNNVIELDAAMTELKKVTDETDAVYDRFLTSAASRAKTVGATLSDVVTATADFARLGYGIDEASTLADTAIVYKNVADGISDISEASQSIISTMKAFGIEAENSMTIADKYNEVSNNFAISSAGIGEAMQRSASALATANNSIDESIALITAANSVVQDEEKVGNAMKTISLRIRGATTELEEAGESTDGMAESTAKLREQIQALAGVDIMIDD